MGGVPPPDWIRVTPFVRDVVLPCLEDRDPQIAAGASRYKLVMGPSGMHRWGVFAGEAIPKGRKVIEYAGLWVNAREARRRMARPRVYLYRFDDEWAVDGAVNGNGSQYINHSCAPNLKVRKLGRHILFFSQRAIAAGEELSIDYEFSPHGPRVECNCGAATCRGTINVPLRK